MPPFGLNVPALDIDFKTVAKILPKPSEYELNQTSAEIRAKTGKNIFKLKDYLPESPCKFIYGMPHPAFSAVDHIFGDLKEEVNKAYFRDFFFIQLRPVKLEKVGGKAPYFVFKTRKVEKEFPDFIYRALNILKTDLAGYISDYVLERWDETRSCFSPPYTFMLDNVSQELSHTNDYGHSFLENLSNFLSQNVSHWIQMFVDEQNAARNVTAVVDTLRKNLIEPLQSTLRNIGVSGAFLNRTVEGLTQVAKIMATGGRFDSPKVWNSSSSNLSLRATINLTAEISNPDMIASRIVEPLLVLWALSIPRGFDRIVEGVSGELKDLAKYFYIWPYYVEAILYRGNPYSDEYVQVLKLPAAAIRGILTGFTTESATYRGESVIALKVQFELDPVYTTVYGTVADSQDETAMMTFNWFIKNTLSNLVKIKYKKSC